MMRDSWKQKWTLVSITLVCGCQLGVEQLEAGEQSSDTESGGEPESTGDGDGDGDGDSLPSDECWAQGTNLDGEPDPLGFPLPECEVVCATGWGHDVGLLPIAWTLDFESDESGLDESQTHLEQLPGGELVVFLSQYSGPHRLLFISPEGEIDDDIEQPQITGSISDVGVDDSGMIYALWSKDDVQSLTAMSSTGEHLWTVDLGPYSNEENSALAAHDAGVVVAINRPDSFDSELMYVSSDGQLTELGPIPFTALIAVSPSGDTIALGGVSILWAAFESTPTPSIELLVGQGVANVIYPFGLVALDDERVVGAGISPNNDEGGSQHGYVHEIGPMGLVWEQHYDRATSWCPGDGTESKESFNDLVQLADGSLLIAGGEWIEPDFYQPWVGHVSAEGEALAIDRGFWEGWTLDAVAADDGSAYVLFHDHADGDLERFHVRKYLP